MIVQDPTLLHQVDLFGGLRGDGYIILNTSKSFADLGLDDLVAELGPERCLALPATELAREHLGRPVPNAPLLGAFAALTGVVSLGAVGKVYRDRFGHDLGERNSRAATAAFELAVREPAHA